MIFNIRGTSGSGKSYLVRKIMDLYSQKEPHFIEGRKRPMYYTLKPGALQDPKEELVVMGHYETACGGCDTIKLMDDVDRYVRELSAKGYHVIFEGVIFSTEYPRTHRMILDGLPIEIINLVTPIEECLAGVNSRRLEKNPEAQPVDPGNTTRRVGIINRCNDRLVESGGKVFDLDRWQAFIYLRHKLQFQEEPK